MQRERREEGRRGECICVDHRDGGCPVHGNRARKLALQEIWHDEAEEDRRYAGEDRD